MKLFDESPTYFRAFVTCLYGILGSMIVKCHDCPRIWGTILLVVQKEITVDVVEEPYSIFWLIKWCFIKMWRVRKSHLPAVWVIAFYIFAKSYCNGLCQGSWSTVYSKALTTSFKFCITALRASWNFWSKVLYRTCRTAWTMMCCNWTTELTIRSRA